MDNNLLNTPEAARFLQVSEATIKSWRALGFGPAYIRVGRLIKYDLEAIQHWLDLNTVEPTGNPMRETAA